MTNPQEPRSTSIIVAVSDYDIATECKYQDPDFVLTQTNAHILVQWLAKNHELTSGGLAASIRLAAMRRVRHHKGADYPHLQSAELVAYTQPLRHHSHPATSDYLIQVASYQPPNYWTAELRIPDPTGTMDDLTFAVTPPLNITDIGKD